MTERSIPYPDNVREIVGHIAMMEHTGDAKAIAAVVLDASGEIQVMIACSNAQKIGLIGGTVLLQSRLLASVPLVNKAVE